MKKIEMFTQRYLFTQYFNNYFHIFSSLCTHARIFVSLNTCSIIYINFLKFKCW